VFKLVTLRSPFSLEQFKRVLQPIAHNIALEAVQKLSGRVAVKGLDGQMEYVVAEDFYIRFYKRSIAYWDYKRRLMLKIEEHPYTDGNLTKIVVQGSGKKVKKKAEGFIADLMKGVKPEQQFSLKDYAKTRGKP
jgi:hypothetical protein